jgi:hypothetical protein
MNRWRQVAAREFGKMTDACIEERIAADQESTSLQLREAAKSGPKLRFSPGL